MNKYLVVVTGDENDGDYIERSTYLTLDELVIFKRVLKQLKELGTEGKRRNIQWANEHSDERIWKLYSSIPEGDLELFNECVPHGTYGIHSITDISLYTVINHVSLL